MKSLEIFDDYISQDELEVLLNNLNDLLSQNNNILEELYQNDIFVRKTLSELQDKHPDLLDLYSKVASEFKWLATSVGLEIKKTNNIEIDNPYLKEDENQSNIKDVDSKTKDSIKTIFRKICRLTHPDKIKSIILNKYFITAKKLYKKNNKAALDELLDLIIIESSNKNASKKSCDLIKEKISTTTIEIGKNKSKQIMFTLTSEYIISIKFINPDIVIKAEGEKLFINHMHNLINSIVSQMNNLKTILEGKTKNDN